MHRFTRTEGGGGGGAGLGTPARRGSVLAWRVRTRARGQGGEPQKVLLTNQQLGIALISCIARVRLEGEGRHTLLPPDAVLIYS